MNFNRFSPALTLSLLLSAISLLGSAQLQAGASNISGNPYGNNSFFPDSGTFSAIVRGTNGFLGVVQFSTTSTNASTNSLTNSGIATVYSLGEEFVGPAFGSVSGSTIAATYNAIYTVQLLVPSNAISTATNGVTTTNTAYNQMTLNDTVNGQFNASLYNSYPTQSFSGTGETTTIFSRVEPDFTIRTFGFTDSNTVSGTRLVQ